MQGTWAVSSRPGRLTKLHAPCSFIPLVLVPMKQHAVCALERRARMESRSLRPQRLPLARPGPLPAVHTQGLTWSVRCCSRPLEAAPRGPAQRPPSLRPSRLPAALSVQGGPVARTQMPGRWGGLRLLRAQPDADDKWPCPRAGTRLTPIREEQTCVHGVPGAQMRSGPQRGLGGATGSAARGPQGPRPGLNLVLWGETPTPHLGENSLGTMLADTPALTGLSPQTPKQAPGPRWHG